MPKISTDIYRQLGLNLDFDLVCGNRTPSSVDPLNLPLNGDRHQEWGLLTANWPLGEPRPIFTKLELPN